MLDVTICYINQKDVTIDERVLHKEKVCYINKVNILRYYCKNASSTHEGYLCLNKRVTIPLHVFIILLGMSHVLMVWRTLFIYIFFICFAS